MGQIPARSQRPGGDFFLRRTVILKGDIRINKVTFANEMPKVSLVYLYHCLSFN
jgi:hypothetical protein